MNSEFEKLIENCRKKFNIPKKIFFCNVVTEHNKFKEMFDKKFPGYYIPINTGKPILIDEVDSLDSSGYLELREKYKER